MTSHYHSPVFHPVNSHPPPPSPSSLASSSSPFPYHTAIGVFAGNFAVSLLCFLTIIQGIDGVPNLYPPSMRRIVIILGGFLFGFYFLIHLFTPVGLLPGAIGISVTFLLISIAGTLPVFLFPAFRDIIHNAPQPWLLGIHTIRCMSYLFLPLLDSDSLPASYAIPVGYGDTLIGLSAPIIAHVFATNTPHAKEVGLGWHVISLAEIVMNLLCGGFFLDPFVAKKKLQKLPVRYLWFTVFLIPRFTLPLLSLMHGYSIWKLLTEKERPAMIWQDGEMETDSIYEIEGRDESEGNL